MNNKTKFAVVGYGHIGKRHATIIDQHLDCELVAICDIKPEKDLALQHFDIPFYASLEQLLAAGMPLDVVVICTPNGLHTVQAMQALEAYKHVVIEKPMGLRSADCERVIHKAFQVSRQIFVVMQNRHSPVIVWLKKMLEESRLGKIFLVDISCYWNRDDRYYLPDGKTHAWHGGRELDGGILYTQFSHFIDIMYWLFGDVNEVQSQLDCFHHHHSTAFEDVGVAQIRFASGALGSLRFSTAVWDKNFESSITVIGQRGTVKIGGQYMDRLEYCHIKDCQAPQLPETNPPNDYGDYKGSAGNHYLVIQNVIDVLQGGETAAANALEGMKVVEIIEKIYNAGSS